MSPTVNCPKCRRPLRPDCHLLIDGVAVPVYVCPECLTRGSFLGQPVDMPLTFVLNAAGRPVDPADPDQELDLTPYE